MACLTIMGLSSGPHIKDLAAKAHVGPLSVLRLADAGVGPRGERPA